jgi:heat shock protein HtpX
MDLWAEPMTTKVATVLLAGLATLFFLIYLEVRSHADAAASLPPRAAGQSFNVGAFARALVLVGLIAAPFLAVGLLFGVTGAAVAFGLAVAAAFRSLRHTGPAALAQCGARTVSDPGLIEAVQELAHKAGIPVPHLLEVQEAHPNAFALGADPAQAAIIVTLGLRTRLTQDELRAVIGHEISHIAHRDTLRATVGVTLMSMLATLALRLRLIGLSVRRQGGGALLFLLVLMPLSALVLHFAAARAREYQADREGALLCGNRDDLISALCKLDASARRIASITANDQPALAALFFVNPLPNSWVGRLFAAHPPVARRIERLRAMS